MLSRPLLRVPRPTAARSAARASGTGLCNRASGTALRTRTRRPAVRHLAAVGIVAVALTACSSSAAPPPGGDPVALADDAAWLTSDLATCEAVTSLRDRIVDHLDEPSLPDLPAIARAYRTLGDDLGSDDLIGRSQHAAATVTIIEAVTPAHWGQIGGYEDLLPGLEPEAARDTVWAVEDQVLVGFRTPVLAADDAAALEAHGCDLGGLDGTVHHLQPGWSEELAAVDRDLGAVAGVVGSWLASDLEPAVLETLCAAIFGDREHDAGWVPTASPSATCYAPDPDGGSDQDGGAIVEITTGALPFGGATVEADESAAGPVLRIEGTMVREATALDLTHHVAVSARVPADGELTEDDLIARTIDAAAGLPHDELPTPTWPGPDTDVVDIDPADVRPIDAADGAFPLGS